jgi:hypothetical protein
MIKFHYENARFDYEPFPICYIPDFIDAGMYRELQQSYPPIELFQFKEYLGNKYSLGEKGHYRQYKDFLKKNEAWREFYNIIKSRRFVEDLIELSHQRNIDLGIKDFDFITERKVDTRTLWQRARNRRAIRSRFEFSIMRASGGHILPHADAPQKLITLVLSFIDKGEWKDEWGGGTDVVLPKDRSKIYNHMNKQMPFSEVEHIKTFPFNENQAVMFIKTYNSWHSVTPMTGPESGLRKTVTINIEDII